MSNNINPFNNVRYDLGEDSMIGYPAEAVSQGLIDSQFNMYSACIICGATATYQLIPKKDSVNTAEIQNRGYICAHCLNTGRVDKNLYGIREMK